jgi:hypothetical protein
VRSSWQTSAKPAYGLIAVSLFSLFSSNTLAMGCQPRKLDALVKPTGRDAQGVRANSNRSASNRHTGCANRQLLASSRHFKQSRGVIVTLPLCQRGPISWISIPRGLHCKTTMRRRRHALMAG